MGKPTVALLIDWENIKYSCATCLQSLPDIITLKKIARKYGKIAVARAYANWTDVQHEGDMQRLSLQNIEPIYVETRNSASQTTVKGSVDIRIACDSIELIFQNSDIDTYVLVSGDGGFSHIVSKLKAYSKSVIAVGIRQTTSSMLATSSSELVFYDDLIKGLRLGARDQKVRKALDLFVAVVDEIRDKKISNTLQDVKHLMQEIDSSFEETAINIPTFRHLAYLAEKENKVKIDATSEPATVYKQSEEQTDINTRLYSGTTWKNFLEKIKKNALYEKLEVKNLILSSNKGVPFDDFLSTAMKSQVLWVDKQSNIINGVPSNQSKWILNTHHPRVQVYYMNR
jgi:uncharacterized protein (TIGR00288 family)